MVKVAASKSKTMIRYKMRFDTVVIDRYRDSAIALDVACRSCAAPVSKKGSSSCRFFDEVCGMRGPGLSTKTIQCIADLER